MKDPSQKYNRLTACERFQIMLHAAARKDWDDVQLIRQAAFRSESATEVLEYLAFLDLARDVAQAAAFELRPMLSALGMAHVAVTATERFIDWTTRDTVLAFQQGFEEGVDAALGFDGDEPWPEAVAETWAGRAVTLGEEMAVEKPHLEWLHLRVEDLMHATAWEWEYLKRLSQPSSEYRSRSCR